MGIVRIEHPTDSRVDMYRDLRDADLIRDRGLFAAEGRLVVRRAIEDRFIFESILVNDAALHDLASSLGQLDPDVPVYVCPAGAFPAVIGFNLHRGCVALVRRPPVITMAALLSDARLLLVLDGVANADNVGGILRNAAAFGADAVLLGPASCDPLYRKAIRTSMGASLRLPFARCEADEWPDVITRLRAARFTTVALTPREPADTLDAWAGRARPERAALVLGAEGAGLTPAIEAAADFRVRIPISDRVDSLNVAVAAGIALFCLGRR